MERLKRNPGGWGLALGGAIGFVSIFFSWMSITNTAANVTSSVPAFRAVSGQTLGFLALLVALAGLGVSASQGSGRIWYGVIGLLGAGVMLAAGLLAIFSPSTIAQLFATTQTMSKLALTSVQNSINETVKAGFARRHAHGERGVRRHPRRDRRAAGCPGRDLRVPQEAAVRRLIDRSILRVRTRA